MTKAPEPQRCQCLDRTGVNGCPAAALWLVGVGLRKMDAQRTCGKHLHRTCQGMREAEDRLGATLTIYYIGPS